MTATTLTPTHSARPRRRTTPIWLTAAAFTVALAPVVLLAGAANPPCPTPAPDSTPSLTPAPARMFAAPLALQPGRWYQVGATEYGGLGDPSAGSYGSIPDPSQAFLPAHSDTFAELSVLDTNPANTGTFTFADANALNNLPYMTGLRVASNGTQRVRYKRDIGYGQGPRQTIANGQPYRLDVWWQSATPLGISKSPVSIQLAPQPAPPPPSTNSQPPAQPPPGPVRPQQPRRCPVSRKWGRSGRFECVATDT